MMFLHVVKLHRGICCYLARILHTHILILPIVATTSALLSFSPEKARGINFDEVPQLTVPAPKLATCIQMEARNDYTWVGLGISTTMATSEVFLIYQDGNIDIKLSLTRRIHSVMHF